MENQQERGSTMNDYNDIHYTRKEYYAKFLFGALGFSLISGDMENGEYRHVLQLKLFGKSILQLCFRTGESEEGKNFSMGYFKSGAAEIDYVFHAPHYSKTDKDGYMIDEWEKGNLRMKRYLKKETSGEGA